MRQQWRRDYSAESPRDRLLREWMGARTQQERTRVLAKWIELYPDTGMAHASLGEAGQ